MGRFQLGVGYQEGHVPGRGQEICGYREDFSQALDCSEGYDVEGCRGEGFGAGVLYIDVRQCKGASYFF
jgi:hypothetical protein